MRNIQISISFLIALVLSLSLFIPAYAISDAELCDLEKEEKHVFDACLREANKGNADAQFAVALLLRNAVKDVERKESVRWLKEAARSSAYAQLYIAEGHTDIEITPEERIELYNNAFSNLKKLATGTPQKPFLYYLLARMYYTGIGTQIDYNEALHFFELADKKGFNEASYEIGKIHYFGKGVKKDVTLARKYFKDAELKGVWYAAKFETDGSPYYEKDDVSMVGFLRREEAPEPAPGTAMPITEEHNISYSSKASAALAHKDKKKAYRDFIAAYQIVSPHPDKTVQADIAKAIKGNSDSFAHVVMDIRNKRAGFYSDDMDGLLTTLALSRAMEDGSAYGAYYIAQGKIYSEAQTQVDRLAELISGMYWMGVATGMGDKNSYKEAMERIDGQIAYTSKDIDSFDDKDDQRESRKALMDFRDTLIENFNLGMIDSAKYKKKSK